MKFYSKRNELFKNKLFYEEDFINKQRKIISNDENVNMLR